MKRLQKTVIELRRREVFRTVGLYVIGSWVTLQVAALAFQSLDIPDSALVWIWIVVFAGFPLVLVFAWRYDLTMHGIVRTPSRDGDGAIDISLRGVDYAILIALAAVAVIAATKSLSEISDIDQGRPETAGQRAVLPNSIAVLPLDNLSGDPEQEFFVNGMHEALISDLARISQLKVISRTSTSQYRDSQMTSPEIATELGVSKLIEGSVLRVEDRVRITVQLIDAITDEYIWSETYERSLSNVLRLQSNLARAIASQVKVKLTPFEDMVLAGSAEVDTEAYEYYLKGRFHWYRFAEGDLALALEYFQRAIDKDPDYALAYVGFADALATPAHVGLMSGAQVFPAASGFVRRALELDPDLAEAHDLLARINFVYNWEWDAAERGFRRAVSLKFGYPDVHVVYSQYLAIMNRWDESLEEARIGLDLDPLNPWFRMEFAQRLAWFGQFDEARVQLDAVIESSPNFLHAHDVLWMIEQQQGRNREALAAAARYFELVGESEISSLLKGDADGADYAELMRRAAILLETKAARQYVSNVELARLRIHAGDVGRTIEYLVEAYSQRESSLVYTAIDPQFRPVWDDERYLALRHKMNLR
jgi:TolB-like protein/Tfp pilus assembly protein PilF